MVNARQLDSAAQWSERGTGIAGPQVHFLTEDLGVAYFSQPFPVRSEIVYMLFHSIYPSTKPHIKISIKWDATRPPIMPSLHPPLLSIGIIRTRIIVMHIHQHWTLRGLSLVFYSDCLVTLIFPYWWFLTNQQSIKENLPVRIFGDIPPL